MTSVIKRVLFVCLPFVLGASSCERAHREAAATSQQSIRELATKYRDDWVAKNSSEDSAQLAHGTIQSVEKTESGWHVVFATRLGGGPGAEEGLHV